MLKLKGVKENFEVLMEECEDYEVFLHKLLEKEIEARDERLVEGRIRDAHFPYKKYLEDLDMRALPVAIRQKLPELSTLGFIEKDQNVIFTGNPGNGKTYISIGLALKHVWLDIRSSLRLSPYLLLNSKNVIVPRHLLTLKEGLKSTI